MYQFSNEDWLINIENTAAKVKEKYGSRSVDFVFSKYGANSANDLNPANYSEVFNELHQMSVD